MTPADSLRVIAAMRATDSLQHVRAIDRLLPASGSISDLSAFMEQWRDFFLLSGTASVTLVGLLFLALSFNMETLIHESKAHLLEHARSIMLSYTFVLVLSLAFLVPLVTFYLGAVLLVVFSLVALGLQLSRFLRRRRSGFATHEGFLRRRTALLVFGYVAALMTGAAMLLDPHARLMYNLVSIVCLLLANAVGSSWDLLVQVAKQRTAERAAAESIPPAPP